MGNRSDVPNNKANISSLVTAKVAEQKASDNLHQADEQKAVEKNKARMSRAGGQAVYWSKEAVPPHAQQFDADHDCSQLDGLRLTGKQGAKQRGLRLKKQQHQGGDS